MLISVVNHTKTIPDAQVHEALRAINRQITEDFSPYWHMHASLRLEGRSMAKPSTTRLPDMRGDAVLYLWDGDDGDDALGYHETTHRGIPYGFVFTRLAEELKENWTVTLSHEALELLGDPEVNLLVQGAHPNRPSQAVFHWFEMCDAVQAETYSIDGIEVSNFVLPLYFTGYNETGSRNDYLGNLHGEKKKPLRSFGINPGGYIGFYNPASGDHETVAIDGDAKALKRLEAKGRFKAARRGLRYQRAATGQNLQNEAPLERKVQVLKRSTPRAAQDERR
jgi:hypothetical protein